MPNKLPENKEEKIKEAVPVLHQYREKYKNKTLSRADLPVGKPWPNTKAPETAEEKLMLMGEGEVMEI